MDRHFKKKTKLVDEYGKPILITSYYPARQPRLWGESCPSTFIEDIKEAFFWWIKPKSKDSFGTNK